MKQRFELLSGELSSVEIKHLNEILKNGKEIVFIQGYEYKLTHKNGNVLFFKIGTKREEGLKGKNYRIISLIKN